MVNPGKINGIFKNLQNYVEKLRTLASQEREEFLADFRNIESAKHLLQVSIECCLDAANHIISSEGFRSPGNYAESFVILVEEGILPEKMAPDLRKMVSFRNRVVHLYWEVDNEILYDEILKHDIQDFDKFVQNVLNYMEKE